MVGILVAVAFTLPILGYFLSLIFENENDPRESACVEVCSFIAAILLGVAIIIAIFYGVALVSNQENAIEAEISAIEEKNEKLSEMIESITSEVVVLQDCEEIMRDYLKSMKTGVEKIQFLKSRLVRRQIWLHGFILPW